MAGPDLEEIRKRYKTVKAATNSAKIMETPKPETVAKSMPFALACLLWFWIVNGFIIVWWCAWLFGLISDGAYMVGELCGGGLTLFLIVFHFLFKWMGF